MPSVWQPRAIPHNGFEGDNLGSQNTGQRRQQADDGIYSRGAWLYRDAGWPGVLPLPPAKKFPPPTGFTGYDGQWPTDEQIVWWVTKRPADANLGLRVYFGFVGLDVDAYGDKTGGLTLEEAERRWGALPPTHRSTYDQIDQARAELNAVSE